jgi:hypothetical protein
MKRVLTDGRETGIDHPGGIFDEVKNPGGADDAHLAEEILTRVKQFNYVPTKKTDAYAAGLVAEYRKSLAEKE